MIKHDSIYSKRFVSNNLTAQKYGELLDIAVRIRDHKNTISQYVCEHLFEYIDVSTFDFLKEMRAKYSELPSSFDKQCYEDVIVAYQNKFDAVKHKLTFENIHYVCCELYKRDTKNHKKGDFKKVKNNKASTSLTITLSYLARYGNEGIIDYLNEQMPKVDEKKQMFYKTILGEINKFGFDRLYTLALSRRERTYKKYAEHPIEFKSLTFRGRSRKKLIIDYNSRFGSVINAFVSLSSLGRKSFDIPVKFNKDYHGSIHDYEKPNPDYEYVVVFNERKKQVAVILTKKQDRYIPEAGNNIVGIDVNVKHNMFTISNGTAYDYDRDLKMLRERLASKFEHYCDYPTFESYMEDDDHFKIYNALKFKGDTESEIFKISEQYVKRKKKRWKHHCQLRNEMPSKIRNGELSDDEFMKLYKKEDLFSTIYETPGFSDNFRTCDYNTPCFRSFEKAKKYLTKYCDKFYIPGKETTFCGTNEEKSKQRLRIMLDICKKFFKKYPKGWIEFG